MAQKLPASHSQGRSSPVGGPLRLMLVLLVFVLDVWALTHVLNGAGSRRSKLALCLVIVLLPILGLLVWAGVGRQRASRQS